MERRLERLEVRNGPTGSTDTGMVDIIPDVISAITSQEVDGKETYRVGLPILSTAWSSLVERQVLKNVMSDGTIDSEWRIVGLKSARTPGALNGTIECESIKYDLNDTIVSRTEDNADVNNYFELYGLTPTQHLDVILEDAPSHFSAGTVASSAPVDMVYDWSNPLSAGTELAKLSDLELEADLTSTGYKVNLRAAIGSTASKVFLRYSRNILGVSRDSDSRTNQGTRVYPRGGGDVGDRLKIAEAAWLVTATSTVSATLSTADGRAIAFADQLNSLWVEEPGGTRRQVTDSTTGQVITIGAGHNISTDERVKFRTSSGGNQLTFLEDPVQVATYGTFHRVLDRQDIPFVDNLVENPFFTGTYTAGIPTNWSKVGVLTFAESTTALFRRYGDKSLHITATSSGRGVISDSVSITPSSAAPFFTVETAIWVVSGSVKLELIDQTSTQGIFPPRDTEPANTTVVGEWVENLVVAGIDMNERSSTGLKLQVTALSTGGAEWYMDAAQITQTAGGGGVFNDGRASNALWIAGNQFLTDNAAPRVTFSVQADDLERLHPDEFSNAQLVVGGTVQVVDADMGLDFQTRIINLQRDLLHPGNSQITLSNRPEDLSGLGIPGRRPKAEKPETTNTRTVNPTVDSDWTRVSSATAQLNLVISDPFLKVKAIEFNKREGSQSGDIFSTAFVSSWDGSTGTIGTDVIMTRREDVTTDEGEESIIRWRVQFTDKNGEGRTIAGAQSSANVDEEAGITIDYPAEMVQAATDLQNYTITTWFTPRGAASVSGFLGFVLPVGVTITDWAARVYRNSTSDVASVTLLQINSTGGATALGSVQTHSGTGWTTLTDSGPNHTVAALDHFNFQISLTNNSSVSDARFLLGQVTIDRHTYSENL